MASLEEDYLTTDLTRETVTNGGSFTITPAAALNGAYGAQVQLTGGAGSYAYQEQQVTIANEIRARFYNPAIELWRVLSQRRDTAYQFAELGSGHGLVAFKSVMPEALAWAFPGEPEAE